MTMPLDSAAHVRIACDASDPTGALWTAVEGTEFLLTTVRAAQRLEVVNDQMECIEAALTGLGLDPAAEPIALIRQLREDADLSRQRLTALQEAERDNTDRRQKLSGRVEKPRQRQNLCPSGYEPNPRRPGQCRRCGRTEVSHG